MSDRGIAVARGDTTRQCMIRVWMAISAVWTAFWLALAAFLLSTAEFGHPGPGDFATFCLIVLTPPIALLGLGALAGLIFEAFKRAVGRSLAAR